MQVTVNVFDEITDFLSSNPSDEEILAYRLPDVLQARAIDLLERNAEDELSFDEEQEMYDYIRVDDMMSLLKAKTRLRMEGQ